MNEFRNILFICSRNQWRSPTAEAIYSAHQHLHVRSAGTSSKARRRLSVKDIRWADLIIVMEEKHRQRIRAEFRDEVRYKAIEVLAIEDRYQFMDPELIDEIRAVVDSLLEL